MAFGMIISIYVSTRHPPKSIVIVVIVVIVINPKNQVKETSKYPQGEWRNYIPQDNFISQWKQISLCRSSWGKH